VSITIKTALPKEKGGTQSCEKKIAWEIAIASQITWLFKIMMSFAITLLIIFKNE